MYWPSVMCGDDRVICICTSRFTTSTINCESDIACHFRSEW